MRTTNSSVDWAHQQHILVPGIAVELAVAGHGKHEGGLDGDEHEHEIEGLTTAVPLVVALGQALDVLAH